MLVLQDGLNLFLLNCSLVTELLVPLVNSFLPLNFDSPFLPLNFDSSPDLYSEPFRETRDGQLVEGVKAFHAVSLLWQEGRYFRSVCGSEY